LKSLVMQHNKAKWPAPC